MAGPRSRPASRPVPVKQGKRVRGLRESLIAAARFGFAQGAGSNALLCSHATAPRIFKQGQACIRLLHLLGYRIEMSFGGKYGGIVLPFGTMASDNASRRVAQRLRIAAARSGTRHDRRRAE